MTDVEYGAFVKMLSQPIFEKVRDMILRKLRCAWRVQ